MIAKQAFRKKIKLMENKYFNSDTSKKYVKTFVWNALAYGCNMDFGTIAAEMDAGRRLKQARCRNKNKWTSAAAPCERMKIYTLDTVMKRKTVLLRHNIFMKNFFERKISKKESSVPTKTLETSIKGRMKTQWTNETDYVWRGSFNTSL